MVLLPKFLGILVFDQANDGAMEAHAELGNPASCSSWGRRPRTAWPARSKSSPPPPPRAMDAIMISNNAGDQIAPAAQAARDAGMTVVTWDSPIPSAEGEQVFVAQVDFDETGTVMADMALSILGDDGGKFAVLSASPDAANQNAWIAALEEVLETDDTYANLELLDIVYGNDQSEDSYNQALALVDKYPDMELIMAPTTVGIAAAAKAMQDEGSVRRRSRSAVWACPPRWSPTPSTAVRRVRPVELCRPRLPDLLCQLPAGHRRHRRQRSASALRPVAWAPTPSRRTPPATPVCAS